jgi:hypothetical protein
MSTSSIAALVTEFVAQLDEAIDETSAEQARDLIAAAFGGGSGAAYSARPPRARAASAGRRSATGRGRKRDPGVIAALTERLGGYIAAHPGQRIEEIAAALGTATKTLVLSVKKLIAGKAILTRGQKRATRYFPAPGRAAKRAKPAASAKPARRAKPAARSARPKRPARSAAAKKPAPRAARPQAKAEPAAAAPRRAPAAAKAKPAPSASAAAPGVESSPPPA